MTDKQKKDLTVSHEDSDEDSDDDFGPKPITSDEIVGGQNTSAAVHVSKKRKIRTLPFEKLFLNNLPSSVQYERSFMHRDVVTHIVVSKATEFIITGSVDGHVKFWKKMPTNIEFVKHFQAHLGAIHAFQLSPDELRLVTTSADKMIKFFEVLSFDMANMISTSFTPGSACWLTTGSTSARSRVAVADVNSGCIRIYLSEGIFA